MTKKWHIGAGFVFVLLAFWLGQSDTDFIQLIRYLLSRLLILTGMAAILLFFIWIGNGFSMEPLIPRHWGDEEEPELRDWWDKEEPERKKKSVPLCGYKEKNDY